MSNAAQECCGCNCVGKTCSKCGASPDFPPNGYTMTIAGVTVKCLDVSRRDPLTGTVFPASIKPGDPNGTFCIAQDTVIPVDPFLFASTDEPFLNYSCVWGYRLYDVLASIPFPALEMRYYEDSTCGSATALWDGDCNHVGTYSDYLNVSLIRIDGGFDLVITQWMIRTDGKCDPIVTPPFEHANLYFGVIVFAGRNASVPNCNASFTINNGTHPDFPPTDPSYASSGGAASFVPCMKDCKACFQTWTMSYDCVAKAWSDPVKGTWVCLPYDAGGWRKTGSRASGSICDYTIYVRANPLQKCKADAPCAGLPDTPTPTKPAHAPPDCCQCTTGRRCYQTWTATWDCQALSWSGPFGGDNVCLPDDTDEGWVKIESGATCLYRKYVALTKCCASGDVTGSAPVTNELLTF